MADDYISAAVSHRGLSAGWAKPKRARKRHYFSGGMRRVSPTETYHVSHCGKEWDDPGPLDPDRSEALFVDCQDCLSHLLYRKTTEVRFIGEDV